MKRLCPLEKDYYLTYEVGDFSDGEDRGSDSSDDEVQKEMAKIAGIQRCLPFPEKEGEKKNKIPEFESDMEDELSDAMTETQKQWFPINETRPTTDKTESPSSDKPSKIEESKMLPLSRSRRKNKTDLEGEVDEALGLHDNMNDSDDHSGTKDF